MLEIVCAAHRHQGRLERTQQLFCLHSAKQMLTISEVLLPVLSKSSFGIFPDREICYTIHLINTSLVCGLGVHCGMAITLKSSIHAHMHVKVMMLPGAEASKSPQTGARSA
jgi:hypothetical protein